MQACRPWDPPAQNDALVRVPASAVAQTLAQSPQAALLEMVGHWSDIDVAIDVPDSWADVTCRLVRTLGGIDTVLDVRAVTDVMNPIVSGGRIGGVLFSIRGRPGDRFRVEAWRTAEDHGPGKIYAIAWGEGDTYGDNATRQPVDLYNATPDKARTFTTGAAGLAVGATIILPANPLPRGRVALTRLTWYRTNDGLGDQSLLIQETDGTTRWTMTTEVEAGGAFAEAIEEWISPPLWSAPGNGWQVVLSGGTPANNILNANAFDS